MPSQRLLITIYSDSVLQVTILLIMNKHMALVAHLSVFHSLMVSLLCTPSMPPELLAAAHCRIRIPCRPRHRWCTRVVARNRSVILCAASNRCVASDRRGNRNKHGIGSDGCSASTCSTHPVDLCAHGYGCIRCSDHSGTSRNPACQHQPRCQFHPAYSTRHISTVAGTRNTAPYCVIGGDGGTCSIRRARAVPTSPALDSPFYAAETISVPRAITNLAASKTYLISTKEPG